MDQAAAQSAFEDFYKDAPFVKVVPTDTDVEVRDAVGTNNVEIQVSADPSQKLVVVASVIDNLIKGASGQAVQNFNLMHGFSETEGIA
jgi:N-acetyl-gamma-glutamyl-phosphate reductase